MNTTYIFKYAPPTSSNMHHFYHKTVYETEYETPMNLRFRFFGFCALLNLTFLLSQRSFLTLPTILPRHCGASRLVICSLRFAPFANGSAEIFGLMWFIMVSLHSVFLCPHILRPSSEARGTGDAARADGFDVSRRFGFRVPRLAHSATDFAFRAPRMRQFRFYP